MNIEIIKRVADKMINTKTDEYHMNIEVFDWGPGVALYGIYAAYKATGEQRFLDFLKGWFDRHLCEAYSMKTVNSTAPLLAAVCLFRENNDHKLIKVCNDIAQYIITQAPITRDGGLEHTVLQPDAEFCEQMWADTVFMSCLFLANLGEVTGKREYMDFAANQLVCHYNALQSETTGLCYHGWDCMNRTHLSGAYWARANAWMVYCMPELLRLIPTFDGRDKMLVCLEKHIEALVSVQKEDNLFGTVLDDPSSYSEISASAGIAAGLHKAVELGYAKEKYNDVSESIKNALLKHIDSDGAVINVSGGTPILKSIERYKNIPLLVATYGQGLMLVSLTGF